MVKLNDNQRVLSSELPKGKGVIGTLVGQQKGILPSPFQSVSGPNGRKIYEVPIDLIKKRAVNNYAITGIEELAESIKRTGLWQPIILRKDPENDSRYIIVAGERRYTAVRLLHERAVKNNETVEEKLFSTISAMILTGNELEKEEAIYSETNEYSRQITNFERILRLDPDSINMNDPETKKEYIALCFDTETDSESVTVRGTAAEKNKYITAVLNHKDPDLDISESTVKAYLIFIDRCSPALLHAILKGVISLREARGSISYLSTEDQGLAIEAAGTDAYERFISKGKEAAELMKQSPSEKPKEPEDLIVSAGKVSKKLYGARKDFEKIYNDTTYRKDLNESQKEYLSKLRLAMAAIESVREAEDKMKAEETL